MGFENNGKIEKLPKKLVEDFNPLGNTFHCFKVLIYVHVIYGYVSIEFWLKQWENKRRTMVGLHLIFSKSRLIVFQFELFQKLS